MLAAGLVGATPAASVAQDACTVGAPIPAYAHNDYRNPRPLFDALALGYQGVEADFHLVRGALMVAHDVHEVKPDRTLESLYLSPLRTWVARCGTVLTGGRPLLLNIEAKTTGFDAYRALVRVLRDYRDILTVVRDGQEIPGPVQVVMVGWHPPLDTLVGEEERLVAIQWYADDPAGVPAAPAHLIRLITLNYGESVDWAGDGLPPSAADGLLERLVRARDAVPGRVARVHNVPVNGAVYRLVLDAGVDLVGTLDLAATRDLLVSR